MKITIYNLGPIKEVSIDLSKHFTILCGLNSTGKTYAAYVVYHLLHNLSGAPMQRFNKIKDITKETSCEITIDDIIEWKNFVEENVKRALPKIFGISRSETERHFAEFSISIDLGEDPLSEFIDYNGAGKIALGSHLLIKWQKHTGQSAIILTPLEDIDYLKGSAKADVIIPTLIEKLISDSFLKTKWMARMLTVERNSIYTFKSELALNRIDFVEEVQEGDESVVRRVNRYPEAVTDSLRTSADLDNITKRDSAFVSIAESLETDILKGAVRVGEHGEVLFEPFCQEEMRLRIQMASSMVKTLSSLDVYLRHLASEGQCLIMDEPEMNLHPQLQRLLARIFARMVNAGIRLLISTHSDYILREINSLVMASSLKESGDTETAAQCGISEDLLLSPDMLQPIAFTLDVNGHSSGRIMEIDKYGFQVEAIDETINRQNEMTIVLSDTLDYYLQRQ